MKPRRSKQTVRIIQALRNVARRGESRGFRARLAERYGVSRQRITNIARTVGLVGGK